MQNYSALKASGKFSGTIKAATAKRKERDNSQKQPRSVKGMAATVLIELSDYDQKKVESAARSAEPRKKNWDAAEPDRASKVFTVQTNDLGNYSSRCTYRHYTYTPKLRSCGKCTPQHLVAFVGANRHRMTARKGWEFGSDEYGMFVVRSSRRHIAEYRYHFDSADARSARVMFESARKHEQGILARKAADKARKAEEKQRSEVRDRLIESGNVWVSFRDARAAGNCAAGIRTFCGQNDLNTSAVYRIEDVQRLVAKDIRVQRTIDAALDRAVSDEIRGYCSI